jgi:hypothetical protein
VDGGPARGVEAEEVDAGPPPDPDVGAHVHLGEAGEDGYRRRAAQSQALHDERSNPDPGGLLVEVQLKLGRHHSGQRIERYRPVGKEEVHPDLTHEPVLGRQGPGPVCDLANHLGLVE